MFYPHARSYQSRSLQALFKTFEQEKKREYVERITEVEHGSFTPMIFSACGGMRTEANIGEIAMKRDEAYSKIVA